MDRKFLANIIVSLCLFFQFDSLLANNVTGIDESYQNFTKDLAAITSTNLSLAETTPSTSKTNSTSEPSVVVIERSKLKKARFLNERSRRQGSDYGYYSAKYGVSTLFDMCPPLATTCPNCSLQEVQAPPGFCNFVVMKVLAISQPQIDDNGRVCGKFGMLKVYGNFDEKEFRRLLRFSVSETCNCAVKASNIYFLISPLIYFQKIGLLFNQIILSEETILISADRYIEEEILAVLNNCPVVDYVNKVSGPYEPSPISPYVPPPVAPPAPYVPPAVPPPAPYVPPAVPPPSPYGPPAVPPPSPYGPPVVPPFSQYDPPPPPAIQKPKEPYEVRPIPAVPITSLPSKHLPSRNKMPFLYPSVTKCLKSDTCPTCTRLENAGDITGQYCVAGFAYLAVMRVPDPSNLQGADAAHSVPTCLNLRTNIIYDVTRTRDPQVVVSALTALLPIKCLECFTGLSGPVIVLIMGQIPPVPPAVQIDAGFQVYILPSPATIVLPSCESYYVYGKPAIAYSLVPVAPKPYDINDCPVAGGQTCPSCQNYPDSSFAHACANGFAIVTELNLAGPYFTSQRLPVISVKTTTSYYTKSIEVIITNPPPLECIKGFFKIVHSIGLAPLNFPGEIIPFVSLPECECLSQGFKRVFIFSSKPLIISQEGFLHLSNDVQMAFLQPDAAIPTCGVAPPSPPIYVSPQPFYIPPHKVHLSPSTRPARVPLTYIPPPPPPPAYIPPTDPPPSYILPPYYLPPPLPSWYIPVPTPPSVPAISPEILPPPCTTETPYAKTPPPKEGCIDYGNGSHITIDTNQEETGVFINVDEDMSFPFQFEHLNSFIYEESSVWAPSFDECLPSVEPSCPHNMERFPEKFEEFFCKAKTALIVAVGINYSILGNETADTKMLTFIQSEKPYIGIDFEAPDNPASLKVTITRNKTMERRIQMQDNADYCYKEKVLVLADLSKVVKPQIVVGGLDVSIPGFCDSQIFDKAPSYGLLLSLHLPSDVKNPLQLTEDFAFIPLPNGKLLLPTCGKSNLEENPPSWIRAQSDKFWVPTSPMQLVSCDLTKEDICETWTAVDDEFYAIPCEFKSAVLVQIRKTSAGDSVGPNLEILENFYENGEKSIVLKVESNVDEEDELAYAQDQYADNSNRCKYASLEVLKDLSRVPLIKDDDALTVIASTKCDHPIFKQANEVVLLLSNELILPNTLISLDDVQTQIIMIPPGTTEILFCPQVAPEEVVAVVDESDTSFNHNLNLDESVGEILPLYNKTLEINKVDIPPGVESFEEVEISCKDHADDSCPICKDIDSISPEEYCNSGLSLFGEVIEQQSEDGTCKNGIIVSLFDVSVRKGVPESKILKLSYTIPSHCSCPALDDGGHILLLLDESDSNTDELTITLSEGKYLYSSPLKTHFPSCSMEDSLQARSRNVDNVIVLDSPYDKMRQIMPESNDYLCPTIVHSCPSCRSMDDKELEDLFCSSDEVLLVSRSKDPRKIPRKFTRIEKATFTQHIIGGNYTLDMNLKKYEGACGLPLAVGNCSDSLDRYYYDAEEETCTKFSYTGCGGNANNFLFADHCEGFCLVEDFCDEGVWDIKNVMKSSDDGNYLDNKFHYALPEHCDCSQMFKDEKKGFLLSTRAETLSVSSIQLSRNFHFVPISKNQRKMKFKCQSDAAASDEMSGNEEKKKEKKKGFSFFG